MIGALAGGVASDIWQALREARSDQTTGASTCGKSTASTSSSAPASAATAATQTNSLSPPPSQSDSVNKLITDIKSLLLNIQSGSATGTNGTSTTDAAKAVQSDLNTLASAQSNGGAQKAGGQHRHHPHPEAVDSDATGTGSTNTASAGSTAADQTLIDTVAKAIKAYAASTGSAATA